MTRTIDLAVIPGDGIGPEVTEQAIRALQAAVADQPGGEDIEFRVTEYDLGAKRYHATGEVLSDETMAQLKTHEAILLGAIGDPSVPSGLLERGLLLKLRFAFDHYVNLRPTEIFPGVSSPLAEPGTVDFVMVREGTEGPYVGNGGSIRHGTKHEVANEVSVNTAFGVERLVRYGFELASKRQCRRLTLVHKHNVLVHAGGMWSRIVEQVSAEYPQVSVDYLHVDAATIFLVTQPSRFDVIVTDNLFGDILTDLAAAISGGIGLAASANINPDRSAPSMFEPIHGSAPDIAGKQLADPTASILSAALLLQFLELNAAAERITEAVRKDLSERGTTKRSTAEVGDAVVGRIRKHEHSPRTDL